jgi:hypothetical protein
VGWGVVSGANAKGVGAGAARWAGVGGEGGGGGGGLTAMGGTSLTMTTGMTQSVARLSSPVCNAHKTSTCNSTTPPINMAVRFGNVKMGYGTACITSSC